jgi:hypothetical protein
MAEKKHDEFKEHSRAYNKATKEFVKNADVAGKAREAAEAVEGAEKDKLAEAERKGRAHIAESDPQVSRDYHEKGSTPRRD